MATSCSSQSSSLAPIDFNLSSSLEDSHGVLSVAVEKCQLCGGTKRPFYCKNCIQRGDFCASKSVRNERYAEKLSRWKVLKKERTHWLEKLTDVLQKQNITEEKRDLVHQSRQCVRLLQKAVNEENKRHAQAQQKLKAQQDANEARRHKASRHFEKLRRIMQYITKIKCFVLQQQSRMEQHQGDINGLRRQQIADLMTYLFPISQGQAKSECEGMHQSTVSALAEARRTSYIRGRWVYTDNGGEHHYKIVEPQLPGTGDYSQYNLWVHENKETVRGPNSHIDQRNQAYTISAGLAFTAQLVTILAYFLDVNLPKKLCYSEFCGHELSESRLNRVVQYLNCNVLQLCFTQNVSPELLHPRHTIHNLLMLLQTQQLGRTGHFEVNPDLLQSLEEGATSPSSDEELSDEDDEPEISERDWEHVPVTLPDVESMPGAIDPYQSTSPVHTRPADPAAAGGLMSSAAASVASLWRAATSRRDK